MTILTRPTLRWAMSFKVALSLLIATAASLYAGKLPGADEAVRQLLPGASYERETHVLTADEKSASAESSAAKSVSALVSRYIVRNDAGDILGYAYLDKHMVRTLPQTLTQTQQ